MRSRSGGPDASCGGFRTTSGEARTDAIVFRKLETSAGIPAGWRAIVRGSACPVRAPSSGARLLQHGARVAVAASRTAPEQQA